MKREINETLSELMFGNLLWGVFWQITGVWFVSDKVRCSIGLWVGTLMVMFCALHMYRAIDRALDFSEKDAQKYVMSRAMMRYGLIVVVFLLLEATKAGNVLCFALGLMGLKAGAYLQPLLHKVMKRRR